MTRLGTGPAGANSGVDARQSRRGGCSVGGRDGTATRERKWRMRGVLMARWN